MAPGLTKKGRPRQEDTPPNKLCTGCRRTCKQPAFALISSCPRYYPLRKKQQSVKVWKQPELFGDGT